MINPSLFIKFAFGNTTYVSNMLPKSYCSVKRYSKQFIFIVFFDVNRTDIKWIMAKTFVSNYQKWFFLGFAQVNWLCAKEEHFQNCSELEEILQPHKYIKVQQILFFPNDYLTSRSVTTRFFPWDHRVLPMLLEYHGSDRQ